MNKSTAAKHQAADRYPGSIKSYTIGFVISIVLTLTAYIVVTNHWFSKQIIIYSIMGLAAVQLVVQLVFFLHLGRESKPRWNLAAFAFMLAVLLILVIGSLWIMNNLNYNMTMSPQEMNDYMLKQTNKGF